MMMGKALSSGPKSKRSSRIYDMPLDPDDELGLLVNQIEQNTFSILSIKQKFRLMEKNSASFNNEATSKMDNFSQIIDDLQQKTCAVLDSFSLRLDKMEVLSFSPCMFHPTNSILITDNHEISSFYSSHDTLYIGTDTSIVLIYNLDNFSNMSEIGPIDSNPITKICVVDFDTTYVVVSTNSRMAYICDPTKQGIQSKIICLSFFSWPQEMSSKYKFGAIRDEEIWLYTNSFDKYDVFPGSYSHVAGGNDCMVVCSKNTAKVVKFIGDDMTITDFSFDGHIDHLTVSMNFFCVSIADKIIITFFDGTARSISVSEGTTFLMSNEFYVFRIGNEMLVEVYEATGESPVSYIGSRDWSPHESREPPTAASFENSKLITARLSKCVIWG
jgi:hypothetical protein